MAISSQSSPELVEVFDKDQVIAWKDFQLSTVPQMIAAINMCQAITAMAEAGFVQKLRACGTCTEEKLLGDLNSQIGPNFLRYLVTCGLLEMSGDNYVLSRMGRLVTADLPLARLGFYLQAYGPVTQRIGDLLTGRVTYGTDVRRDGGQLSRHSATVFTRFYTPIILDAMRTAGATCLLDLGCGAGPLLIDACLTNPALTGIGIDIEPQAIEIARERARKCGIADRLEFVVADAFDPASWPEQCVRADSLCTVGVLHEAFRDGEMAVVRRLSAYTTILPRLKLFLLGEPELLYDNRENDSDFFLVHLLTGQGIPRDRNAWLQIFEKAGLECRRILTPSAAGPRICFYDLTLRGTGQRKDQ